MQASEKFQKVVRNIARYKEQKAKKYVTLNEEKFLKERAELNADKEEEKAIEKHSELNNGDDRARLLSRRGPGHHDRLSESRERGESAASSGGGQELGIAGFGIEWQRACRALRPGACPVARASSGSASTPVPTWAWQSERNSRRMLGLRRLVVRTSSAPHARPLCRRWERRSIWRRWQKLDARRRGDYHQGSGTTPEPFDEHLEQDSGRGDRRRLPGSLLHGGPDPEDPPVLARTGAEVRAEDRAGAEARTRGCSKGRRTGRRRNRASGNSASS